MTHNRHRNLEISRARSKDKRTGGTSLFPNARTNQKGCPKGSPW